MNANHLFPLPEPELQFRYPREQGEMSLMLQAAFKNCGKVGFFTAFDDLDEAITYATRHGTLGICLDFEGEERNAKVIGILLIEWNHKNAHHGSLHIFTWANEVDWVKYFNEVVKPVIFDEWLEKLIIHLPIDKKAIMIIAKRIGFEFSSVQYRNQNFYVGELTNGNSKET